MKREIICGIYKITSPVGKMYIGKSEDIYVRWDSYKRCTCKAQVRLYYSLKKYGSENHKYEIVEICPEIKLNEREIYFIKFYDTFDTPHGLNLQSGGEGGKLSKESREKISKAATGRKCPEGAKEKLRKIMTGRKFSEETIEKMKRSAGKHLKGKKLSPEQIEKSSSKLRGRKRPAHIIEMLRNRKKTEEEKRDISKRIKAYWDKQRENGPIVFSDEIKSNMSKAAKQRWDSLTPEERLVINLSRRGKKRTEEHKENYRRAHRIRKENGGYKPLREEHKEKIRKSLIGNKRRQGTNHSEEDKKKISEASKENWKIRKEDPEYNSDENKKKRSELARIAALKGVAKRKENPLVFTQEEKGEMSRRSREMWAKRRALGLKNRPEIKKRKRISEETRQVYIDARKREMQNPEYYSEENRKKRSEAQKRAHETRRKNEEKRIEQERLTMVF